MNSATLDPRRSRRRTGLERHRVCSEDPMRALIERTPEGRHGTCAITTATSRAAVGFSSPRCAEGPPNCSFEPSCDGSVLTTCQCDLVVARQDCGAAELCRKVGAYRRCTETAAPDPRCGDPPPLSSTFCDGDTVVGCGYGYTESHIDCGSVGYTCGVTGGQASCEAPRTGP